MIQKVYSSMFVCHSYMSLALAKSLLLRILYPLCFDGGGWQMISIQSFVERMASEKKKEKKKKTLAHCQTRLTQKGKCSRAAVFAYSI